MKAIIENKNTYKITAEKGDFFITEDVKGKVKMFAKKDVAVVEIEEMPKAKVYKNTGKAPSDKQYNKFLNQIREAEFQDNYLECQRPYKF